MPRPRARSATSRSVHRQLTGMPDQTADATAVATDKPSWLESVELAAAHTLQRRTQGRWLGLRGRGWHFVPL